MAYLNYFMFCPGGEHESGNVSSQNTGDEIKAISSPDPENKEADNEHKSVKDKIKDALQDWSNKDKQDTEFDDTKV